MFSRREPTQPQKVMTNMMMPTIINITEGSTDRYARAASEKKTGLQKLKTETKTCLIKCNRKQRDTWVCGLSFCFTSGSKKAQSEHLILPPTLLSENNLPACFIMRAYTPIDTIAREINWGRETKKNIMFEYDHI